MDVRNIYEDDDELDGIMLIIFGIPRRIYDRSEYFNTFDRLTFFKRFRVTKETALDILELMEGEIEYPYDFNNCIAPMNQLLIFLRSAATDAHLTCIGDFIGAHYSTVSRVIVRVSRAIARYYNRFIKMPQNENEIQVNHLKFYEKARFPRVIGAVDCTHVKIQSPGGEDAEIYRNRKGCFSINVQAIVSAYLKLLNLVACWPGSTHDATIFNNSRIKQQFEEHMFPNSVLLGDSGYFLRPYLITPLINPVTRQEQLFNESHIRTRNVIEIFFGVFKRRFPILAYGCRLNVNTILTIIVAVGVVYNICKANNEDEPPDPEDIERFVEIMHADEVPNVPEIVGNIPAAALGNNVRLNLINNYFANLYE